jgi:Sec-independent protein secretion pathway component TatC
MNPLRWDVLLVGLVFCLPVLLMGLRGDLTVDQMTGRLPWCLLAGWVAVAVVRSAMTPPPEPRKTPTVAERIAALGLEEFAPPLDPEEQATGA